MNIILACVLAAAISFGISFGLGYVVIPFLHKLKFGQTILDIGPKWHKNKQGTPTMGGILFILGTVIAFAVVVLIDRLMGGDIIASVTGGTADVLPQVAGVAAASNKVKVWAGLVMALGFAFIGFLDDYIKVVKKRNMGLTIVQKSVLQIVLMVGYILTLYINDPTGATFIPFIGMVETKLFFWVIGFIVIYATTNAVNFTDGVDGLCSCVTIAVTVFFVIAAAAAASKSLLNQLPMPNRL